MNFIRRAGQESMEHGFPVRVAPFSTDVSTSKPIIPAFSFNAIAHVIRFFTGSTTSTKNTYQFYFLADLEIPTKPVEVCYAIQR